MENIHFVDASNGGYALAKRNEKKIENFIKIHILNIKIDTIQKKFNIRKLLYV